MALKGKHYKEIDWAKVELYLKAGSNQRKIAIAMGIEEDTLRKRAKEKYGKDWSAIAAEFCCTGELLIEATQLQKALSGNIQMLMWLGKIRCGQREPDLVSAVSPVQDEIEKDHLIMQLMHENEKLKSNGSKSQTNEK
jgi:hypothetical protein